MNNEQFCRTLQQMGLLSLNDEQAASQLKEIYELLEYNGEELGPDGGLPDFVINETYQHLGGDGSFAVKAKGIELPAVPSATAPRLIQAVDGTESTELAPVGLLDPAILEAMRNAARAEIRPYEEAAKRITSEEVMAAKERLNAHMAALFAGGGNA